MLDVPRELLGDGDADGFGTMTSWSSDATDTIETSDVLAVKRRVCFWEAWPLLASPAFRPFDFVLPPLPWPVAFDGAPLPFFDRSLLLPRSLILPFAVFLLLCPLLGLTCCSGPRADMIEYCFVRKKKKNLAS